MLLTPKTVPPGVPFGGLGQAVHKVQRLGGAVLHADEQHAPLGPHLQADVAAVRLQRGHRLDGVVQRVAEQRVHLAGLQEVQLCTVGDVIQLDAAALAHDGALASSTSNVSLPVLTVEP